MTVMRPVADGRGVDRAASDPHVGPLLAAAAVVNDAAALTRLLGIAPLDGGDGVILLVAAVWPVVVLEVAKVRRARR